MISKSMFYGNPTIGDYRDMDILKIICEYLLFKGTWSVLGHVDGVPQRVNKKVRCKDLVPSGLFVYGLKDNATNRRAVEYYCEKWGRINMSIDKNGFIIVPTEVWEDCDRKNKEFTKGLDRVPKNL